MLKYVCLYLSTFNPDLQLYDLIRLIDVLNNKYRFMNTKLDKKRENLLKRFNNDEFCYTVKRYLKHDCGINVPFLNEFAQLIRLMYQKQILINYNEPVPSDLLQQMYKTMLECTPKKHHLGLKIVFLLLCTQVQPYISNEIKTSVSHWLDLNTHKKKNNLHVGIIMDGNRRFSKEYNLPFNGHMYGALTARSTIECAEQHPDITQLTLYTLSIDNLNKRNTEEINTIYNIVQHMLKQLLAIPIRVRFIGKTDKLPLTLQKLMKQIEWRDVKNPFTVNFAIAYDSDQPSNLSPIDIVIRTGKVKRLSGFFPMQTRYSELFFLDKYWPQFSTDDLYEIVDKFWTIQRNFGK